MQRYHDSIKMLLELLTQILISALSLEMNEIQLPVWILPFSFFFFLLNHHVRNLVTESSKRRLLRLKRVILGCLLENQPTSSFIDTLCDLQKKKKLATYVTAMCVLAPLSTTGVLLPIYYSWHTEKQLHLSHVTYQHTQRMTLRILCVCV